MTYENILVEREGGLEIITFNRPNVLNALNSALLDELEREIDILIKAEDIGVVILTGAGEKAFIAGADIKELKSLNSLEAEAFSRKGHRILRKLETLPQPTIAAVNGFALGGGCELCMACDIRLASEKAKFGQPEINLGLIPGFGGTQRLPRYVGRGRALEMILTGEMISADEALRIGLVNHIYPPDKLMTAAKEMANKILQKSKLISRMAKEAVSIGINLPLYDGCNYEIEKFAITCSTEDKLEGTTAFLEKRPPVFKGK